MEIKLYNSCKGFSNLTDCQLTAVLASMNKASDRVIVLLYPATIVDWLTEYEKLDAANESVLITR